MKKKFKLNEREQEQIDLLKKYYEIDDEKRIIKVVLHYASIDEILLCDIESINHPQFDESLLRKISDLFASFPLEYKVDICLKIDDYKGYDPKDINDAFLDKIKMFNYETRKETSHHWLVASGLAFISIIIMFVRILLTEHDLIPSGSMIDEILDIVSWVFLWEAVTIVFLSPSDLKQISMKIAFRISSVFYLDKDSKILFSQKIDTISKDAILETRRKAFGRATLLCAGTASIVTGVISSINLLITMLDPELWKIIDVALFLPLVSVNFLLNILFVIGGLAAVSYFQNRRSIQRFVPFFAYSFLIVDSILIIGAVVALVISQFSSGSFGFTEFFSLLLSLVISIAYSIGYFLTKRNKKHA